MRRLGGLIIGSGVLLSLCIGILVLWVFEKGPIQTSFTFDDGTIDHYDVAAPTLEKYGYRGLFSIIPVRVGTTGYMNWDQIRDLDKRGHIIGSHTMNHCNLRELLLSSGEDAVIKEIKESKVAIERELGHQVKFLCLPHMGHNERVFELIRENGMEPVSCVRANLGGAPANSRSDVHRLLADVAKTHAFKDYILMFHVTSSGSGYASYGDRGETFSAIVSKIKENDGGGYKVVTYGNGDWEVLDQYSISARVRAKIRKFLLRLR